MKNENNDYVNKITRKMVSSLSQIVEIQEYNLDDLTILIRDLKETERFFRIAHFSLTQEKVFPGK